MRCECAGKGYVEVKAVEGYTTHSAVEDRASEKRAATPRPKRVPFVGEGRPGTEASWRIVTFKVPCECEAAGAWVARHV